MRLEVNYFGGIAKFSIQIIAADRVKKNSSNQCVKLLIKCLS